MPIDGTIIQRKVWYGYGIAGRKTGFPHDQYRPLDAEPPIRSLNRIDRMLAVMDARPSYKFSIPALHADRARYALVEGSKVLPGDYLVGPQETVFIAAMPALQPIVCFSCNSTISLYRATPAPGFGAIDYRSDATTQEEMLFEGWPVSMVFGGRGTGGTDIPGGQSSPDYQIIMPAVPCTAPPRPGDVVTDDAGRRFALGWWEGTELGWRMLARLLTAS